jgi:hypothetical protein
MAQITERNLTVDEREMIDTLYSLWAKTTGVGDCYWDYEDIWEDFNLRAVNSDGELTFLGYTEIESDADWITAIHGAFPELVRRFHTALDECDRADSDRDSRECRIAELEMEVAELKEDLQGLVG